MKNQAKLAGVDTNMRVAEGIIQSMINRYDASQITTLETDIAAKLPTDVENPYTGAKGTTIQAATGTTLPYGYIGGAAKIEEPSAPTGADAAAKALLKGDILYTTFKTGNTGTDVNVILFPYDEAGNPMTKKIITK